MYCLFCNHGNHYNQLTGSNLKCLQYGWYICFPNLSHHMTVMTKCTCCWLNKTKRRDLSVCTMATVFSHVPVSSTYDSHLYLGWHCIPTVYIRIARSLYLSVVLLDVNLILLDKMTRCFRSEYKPCWNSQGITMFYTDQFNVHNVEQCRLVEQEIMITLSILGLLPPGSYWMGDNDMKWSSKCM